MTLGSTWSIGAHSDSSIRAIPTPTKPRLPIVPPRYANHIERVTSDQALFWGGGCVQTYIYSPQLEFSKKDKSGFLIENQGLTFLFENVSRKLGVGCPFKNLGPSKTKNVL